MLQKFTLKFTFLSSFSNKVKMKTKEKREIKGSNPEKGKNDPGKQLCCKAQIVNLSLSYPPGTNYRNAGELYKS